MIWKLYKNLIICDKHAKIRKKAYRIMVMKIDGWAPFSEYIHMENCSRLSMNYLDITRKKLIKYM